MMGRQPFHNYNMLVASSIALLIFICQYVASFAPTSFPRHTARVVFPANNKHVQAPSYSSSSSTYWRATSLSTTLKVIPKVSTTATTQEASQELLRLLFQKSSSTNSKANNVKLLDNQINSLVRLLIRSKTSFDPEKCIDGPLFASIYFIGNTPLWEKIGSGFVRNVKGQKYTLNSTSGTVSGGGGTFVNYAEIWGNNFYLKASGDFIAAGPVLVDEDDMSPPLSTLVRNKESTTNPFGGILSSLFPFNTKSNNVVMDQSTLIRTPYDYSATVTGASIVLFQTLILNITIEGTGTVRVLYADENLRIFVSPTDTNVTRGGGDWENEGLIVVQVRVDLVYDDWIDRL